MVCVWIYLDLLRLLSSVLLSFQYASPAHVLFTTCGQTTPKYFKVIVNGVAYLLSVSICSGWYLEIQLIFVASYILWLLNLLTSSGIFGRFLGVFCVGNHVTHSRDGFISSFLMWMLFVSLPHWLGLLAQRWVRMVSGHLALLLAVGFL